MPTADEALGQVLAERIGDRRFRVIGVLAAQGESLGFNTDEIVIVPVAAAQALFNTEALFRILVEPAPGKPAWPERRFVRLGGKVQGWVQGETVTVGYELWRQLNDFPLEFGQTANDKNADKDDDKKIAAKAGKPK